MLANTARKKKIRSTLRLMRRNWTLYLLLLPAALYIFMFCYRPMYGVQIAFKNFTIAKGVSGSPWVGLKWFKYFFHSPNFTTVLWNMVILSLYGLVAGFPVPILQVLMLHNVPSSGFKRVTQTVAYLPHFISTVVVVTIFPTSDGKAAVWCGVMDDLWSLGAPRGEGGPLCGTAVLAGEVSDPFLLAGYRRKTLTLRHDQAAPVVFTVEVDMAANGDFVAAETFEVPAGKEMTIRLEDSFVAHWVRFRTNASCSATALPGTSNFI